MTISYLYIFHSIVFHCLGSVGYVAVPHDAVGTWGANSRSSRAELLEGKASSVWQTSSGDIQVDTTKKQLPHSFQKKKYIDKNYFLFKDFLLNLILFIASVGPGALHVPDAGYQMAILQFACLMCQGMKYSYPNGKHQNHPTGLQSRIWMYMKRPNEEFRTIQWCHNLVFWKLDENMRNA